MKRRKFISNVGKMAIGSQLILNGMPMSVFGSPQQLSGIFDDRILVLIQLVGGNDGINTLIPIQQYGTYQSLRTNMAIPDSGSRQYIDLDGTLPAPDQIGLHPDMNAFKQMYDGGLVNIIQGVGYANTNFSHFRSRDIWYMGGDFDEYKYSGWMGRYLDNIYPNYPDDYPNTTMPDPLGLEIGVKVSLGYYREQGIPTAIATSDPGNFNNLISGLGGVNPSVMPDDHYGDELENIIGIYANAADYAQQLENRYNAGTNNVPYPDKAGTILPYPGPAPNGVINNPLGEQLQTVARLIQGGSKTKIYLVRMGGFDTHNEQVIANDTTHGIHGALLFHLSNAVKAFYDDLAVSGLDEEVISMTYTDFGRRPTSNGSFGTDHGSASPTFVFGKGVQPGVIGTNPSLTSLDDTGNLLIQNDYRQIITTLLADWMGANSATIAATELTEYATQKLPIINPAYSSTSIPIAENGNSFDANIFPNPVENNLNIALKANKADRMVLTIYNTGGQQLMVKNVEAVRGQNNFKINVNNLPAGLYHLTLQKHSSKAKISKSFVKK